MALKVVSSQSSTELERNNATSQLEYPFRALAANVLRIVRGAGRPEVLQYQLSTCLQVLDAYRTVVGAYPKAKVFKSFLNLSVFGFDPDEWASEKERAALEVLSLSGYPERMEAERMIHRGSLQVAASRLMSQHTQEIAGEHEMYQGVHLLKDSLAVGNIYWRRRMAKTQDVEDSTADDDSGPQS